MNTWFDPETGLFRLDEVVAERETFKKIMADGLVTGDELVAQSQHVLELLHTAEAKLDEPTRAFVLELLAEVAVLYAANQCYNLQETDARYRA